MGLLCCNTYVFPKGGNQDLARGFSLWATPKRDDQLQGRSRRSSMAALKLGHWRGHHNIVLGRFILPLMFPQQKATWQTTLGFLLLGFSEFCLAKPSRHSWKRKEGTIPRNQKKKKEREEKEISLVCILFFTVSMFFQTLLEGFGPRKCKN